MPVCDKILSNQISEIDEEEDKGLFTRVRVFRSHSGKLIGEYYFGNNFLEFLMKVGRRNTLFGIMDMISKSYFCDSKEFVRLMVKFQKMYFLQRFEIENMVYKCYFWNSQVFDHLGVAIHKSVKCLGCRSQVYLPRIRCSGCVA